MIQNLWQWEIGMQCSSDMECFIVTMLGFVLEYWVISFGGLPGEWQRWDRATDICATIISAAQACRMHTKRVPALRFPTHYVVIVSVSRVAGISSRGLFRVSHKTSKSCCPILHPSLTQTPTSRLWQWWNLPQFWGSMLLVTWMRGHAVIVSLDSAGT